MKDKDALILESLYEKRIKNNCCSLCGFKVFQNDIVNEATNRIDCNGYIIFQGKNYVCIATGMASPSQNEKTGPMVQITMLYSEEKPTDALKSGKDATVCFNCKHRGTSCYVNAGRSLNGTYQAYKDGNYSDIRKYQEGVDYTDDVDSYVNYGMWQFFKGKSVRFGAYGEPVRIPYQIVEKIVENCDGYTGYTHQWKRPEFQGYKKYFMASVDTIDEYNEAKKLGWRTFRVSEDWSIKSSNELACVYSRNGTQCIDCLKCCGTSLNEKDIYVKAHGLNWKVNDFVKKFGVGASPDPLTPEDQQHIDEIQNREKEQKEQNELAKKEKEAKLLAKKNKL